MDGTQHLDVAGEWGRFCRHAGMISLDAQKRIQASTVAIAGVGGIGGAVAMMCAKAGFGRLILCDRDKYELANVVEQMFATHDTVNEDKTAAAAREVKRHCPECEVKCIQQEIVNQADATMAIEGADYVVSGVDNPLPRIWLSRAARRGGVPLLVPANIGWSILYDSQMPDGAAYEERRLSLPGVRCRDGALDLDDERTREIVQVDWDIWLVLMGDFTPVFTESVLKGNVRSYPYMAAPAFFGASFGVSQLIALVCNQPASYVYPHVFCFNMRTCRSLDWNILGKWHAKLISSFAEGGRDGVVRCWREMSMMITEGNGAACP